jgi:hypothetical protein
MTRTHTFTYAVEYYANPHLVCQICDQRVVGRVVAPGNKLDFANEPCQHLGVTSMCPSWGPVDGCECDPVDHETPTVKLINEPRDGHADTSSREQP